MRRLFPAHQRLHFNLQCVHPVDKSLLMIMLVLIAQSIYSLFFPLPAHHVMSDIDIIVRTSAASIFGYFLSANFVRHADAEPREPLADTNHILEPGHKPLSEAQSAVSPSDPTTADTVENTSSDTTPYGNCLQVAVATTIGLFCLLALLLLRNLTQLGLLHAEADAVSATVIQFRDFISGCVGFLIGCPTHDVTNTPQ